MTKIFFKKKSKWVLNTCESRSRNFKAKQLFVADDRRGLEMGASVRRGSWSGVPWSYPHFVLEFSLISMVSVYWGNEKKKEKIERKRWDLRELPQLLTWQITNNITNSLTTNRLLIQQHDTVWATFSYPLLALTKRCVLVFRVNETMRLINFGLQT